jgi:hypothetical protein
MHILLVIIAPTLMGLVARRKTLSPWKYLMVLELQEWLRKARLVYRALPMVSMRKPFI